MKAGLWWRTVTIKWTSMDSMDWMESVVFNQVYRRLIGHRWWRTDSIGRALDCVSSAVLIVPIAKQSNSVQILFTMLSAIIQRIQNIQNLCWGQSSEVMWCDVMWSALHCSPVPHFSSESIPETSVETSGALCDRRSVHKAKCAFNRCVCRKVWQRLSIVEHLCLNHTPIHWFYRELTADQQRANMFQMGGAPQILVLSQFCLIVTTELTIASEHRSEHETRVRSQSPVGEREGRQSDRRCYPDLFGASSHAQGMSWPLPLLTQISPNKAIEEQRLSVTPFATHFVSLV